MSDKGQKLRVLVVSQYFWPETFRVNEVVAYLAARGHHVTVLTGYPNYPAGQVFPEFRSNPQAFNSYNGATIVRVPLIARGQNSKFRLIGNYVSFVATGLSAGIWKLRGRPFDVIFVVQLSPATAAIPALALRRLKKAPTAMWILDLWPETLVAVGVVKSKRALGAVGKMMSAIYHRIDEILIQSRAFTRSIQDHTNGTANVTYWPAWAESDFEGGLEGVKAAPEVVAFTDTFNVVFAGNLGDAQDLPAVISAAEMLKNDPRIRWLIIGDGRASAKTAALIRERGLEASVHMLGRHAIERMPEFFKVAGALLVSLKPDPLFSMTVPGKLQSYLRTGLPIIAMLDGEGSKIVKEAGAGLTCPAGDSQALAHAVATIAGWTPEQRKDIGAKAIAYCREHFDRLTLLQQLEHELGALAARRKLTS